MKAQNTIATQPQLAEKSGVGQNTISRILLCNGAATLDVIAKIAHGIGCQPWELLVDEEETRREAMARMLNGR